MPLSFVELEEAFRGLFDGRLSNLRLAVPASQLQFSEPRQDVGLVEVRSAGCPSLAGLPRHPSFPGALCCLVPGCVGYACS